MRRRLPCLLIPSLLSACTAATTTAAERDPWQDAVVLENGLIEVTVVPGIGRVTQLRLLDGRHDNGVFWENPKVRGRLADPNATEWPNFGGDKAWPAPQADWPKVTPRAWPPPVGFDALPFTVERAANAANTLTLRSTVDPHYGIRVLRRLTLTPSAAEMVIDTTFEKLEGAPVDAGVWVITQLTEPERVFMTSPERSTLPGRYARIEGEPPYDYREHPGMISVRRDPKHPTKLGNDGDALVWVGKDYTLKVTSPRVQEPGARYPDHGSSTEVYTRPDPEPYVEVETLGPLSTLKVGDTLTRRSVYLLVPRMLPDAVAEAQRMVRLP